MTAELAKLALTPKERQELFVSGDIQFIPAPRLERGNPTGNGRPRAEANIFRLIVAIVAPATPKHRAQVKLSCGHVVRTYHPSRTDCLCQYCSREKRF